MRFRTFFAFLSAIYAACTLGAGCSDDSPADASRSGEDAGPTDDAAAADGPVVSQNFPLGAATPNEKAGTRLIPVYAKFESNDGGFWLEHLHWLDTARDETCTPRRMVDGKFHCVPHAIRPGLVPERHFQDSSCVQPVIGFYNAPAERCELPTDPKQKPYAEIPDEVSFCGAPTFAHLPTEAPLALTKLYVKRPNGACEEFAPDPAYDIYPYLGPLKSVLPHELTTFAEAIETAATQSRLQARERVLTGDDGSESRTFISFYDTIREEACRPDVTDDALRCLPSAQPQDQQVGVFIPPGCTSNYAPMGNARLDCSDEPNEHRERYFVANRSAQNCFAAAVSSRQLPDKLSTITYKPPGSGPNDCFDLPAPTDGRIYYSKTTAVPGNSFAAFSRELEDATFAYYGKPSAALRLVRAKWTWAAGGPALETKVAPVDSASGASCTPVKISSGQVVCATAARPFPIPRANRDFADPSCNVPAVGVLADAAVCDTRWQRPNTTHYIDELTEGSACARRRVVRLPDTAKVLASVWTKDSNGACTALLKPSGISFYSVPDLVDVEPSELIELQVSLVRP